MAPRAQDSRQPLPDVPENRGLYLFLVRLREPARVEIGALGTFDLAAGWYVYTGRARRNLMQRVRRHFKPHKRVRWHIDRLVEAAAAEPLGAVVIGRSVHPEESECALNQRVGAALAATSPVPGFGASDCTARCPAHLWYVANPLSLLQLAAISSPATVVLPRGRGAADDPSPDWPEGMPRYIQLDAPGHE